MDIFKVKSVVVRNAVRLKLAVFRRRPVLRDTSNTKDQLLKTSGAINDSLPHQEAVILDGLSGADDKDLYFESPHVFHGVFCLVVVVM